MNQVIHILENVNVADPEHAIECAVTIEAAIEAQNVRSIRRNSADIYPNEMPIIL